MRRYRLLAHGSLDMLVLEDAPAPHPGPDEVIVRIRAVSLNARDLMMVYGPPPYGPKPGIVPASDGAGEVVACGSNVTDLALGTRVVIPFRPGWIDGPLQASMIATDLGGAVDGVLAEQVAVAANAVVPLPNNLSYEQGACLPCAGVTAWTALSRGSPLGQNSTVLTMGTGGVSIFALQIARARGCRVIATTSSENKAEHLRRLGADAVINYRDCPDWEDSVLELTSGRGVDRVVEVGGPGTLSRSIAVLAPEGEVALIGLLADTSTTISPLPLMRTMGVIRGISVGSRADLAALTACASAHFTPVIDKIFGFEQAQEAIAYLASRLHFGKVVIRV